MLLLTGMLAAAGGCKAPEAPDPAPVSRAWEQANPPAISGYPDDEAILGPVGAGGGKGASRAGPQGFNGGGISVTAEQPGAAVATVNGSAITWAQLTGPLIEAHGIQILEQLIFVSAAEQRGRKMGLAVTDADVKAEHERALKLIGSPGGGDAPVDRVTAERLLNDFLRAKNISAVEWDLRMRQRAWVGKIAGAEVAAMNITGPMLEEEYARRYGERVQVRHIEVGSLDEAGQIRRELIAGKDFELLARRHSRNQFTAAQGGLMPPFTRADARVTPAFADAAFALIPGEISPPIQEGGSYQILRLEQRIPATGGGVESVDRADLTRRLRQRLTEERRADLEENIFQQARVTIREPLLRKQFEARYPGR